MNQDSAPVRLVRVYSRGASGALAAQEWVAECPRRGRVGLEVCVDCQAFVALEPSPDLSRALLRCRAPEPRVALRALTRPEARDGDSKIGSLLGSEYLCLTAELGVEEVATLFVSESLQCAPVVDAERRPLGVVSTADLTRWYWQRQVSAPTTVREIMRPVVVVNFEVSVDDAARIACDAHAECVVVVGRTGRIEGFVTLLELLACISRRAKPAPA